MIYINKNTETVIVPRVNQTLQQNRIVVTNQITNRTYELSLTDISTDKFVYEYNNPVRGSVKGYEGSYDYKIMHDDIVLSSGIVVVESEAPNKNTTDKVEYQYTQNIVQYTPDIEYVPVVDRVKDITENGTYNVENFDKVNVEVTNAADCGEIIEELRNEINQLESDKVNLEDTINTLENEVQDKEADIAYLQEKVNSVTSITINEEGTYVAPEGILGWNEVVVDIQEPEEPFVPEYLKFEGIGYVKYVTDGTLSPNLEISRDGVNFTPYGILGGSYSIEGNKPLYIRGVNNTQISDINNHFAFSIPNSNHRIYVSGNIMSLVDGEGRTKVIPDDNMFSYLFANEEQGEDIYFGDLTLPATTLTKGCYKGMFLDTKTSSVPSILPATTLQDECYESMFEGTNIFNSPYIMAEYLQKDCLKHTFRRAGKLEHAFIFVKNLYNADYYWGDGEELQIDMDNCAYECFLLAGSTLIDDCNCDHKTPRTYLLCSEQMECEWNTYDYHKNMGIFITSLPQSLINNIIQ